MVWAISGYFGISYLFLIAPWIYVILKIVGGSYLIYLGFNCIIKHYKKSKNEALKETLLICAKERYVEVCQINAKENCEDISAKQVKEESL